MLTDEKYFQGSFDFLPLVRAQVSVPVLCKDFVIDPYQIYLARHYQADAVLLMLSVLTDRAYRELAAVATSLQMGILTEVSNRGAGASHRPGHKVVGINNRNLRDLTIDLNRITSNHGCPAIASSSVNRASIAMPRSRISAPLPTAFWSLLADGSSRGALISVQ